MEKLAKMFLNNFHWEKIFEKRGDKTCRKISSNNMAAEV